MSKTSKKQRHDVISGKKQRHDVISGYPANFTNSALLIVIWVSPGRLPCPDLSFFSISVCFRAEKGASCVKNVEELVGILRRVNERYIKVLRAKCK
jgi:hypothetical protein